MARFIQQPNMGLPSQSAQNIHHFIEMFEANTVASLQTAVNAFLLGLESVPEFPIVVDIEYHGFQDVVAPGAGDNVYSAMVHYILVD